MVISANDTKKSTASTPPSVSVPHPWKMVLYAKYQGLETPIEPKLGQDGTLAHPYRSTAQP